MPVCESQALDDVVIKVEDNRQYWYSKSWLWFYNGAINGQEQWQQEMHHDRTRETSFSVHATV